MHKNIGLAGVTHLQIDTRTSSVPKKAFHFEAQITKLNQPVGPRVTVILHERASGNRIATTETDEQSRIKFFNLDKTKAYYLIALDNEEIFQSVVYDLSTTTNALFETKPSLTYSSRLGNIPTLANKYVYYANKDLAYDPTLIFSVSGSTLLDTNRFYWHGSGNINTDIVDGYESLLFQYRDDSYVYLVENILPTMSDPYTLECFIKNTLRVTNRAQYIFKLYYGTSWFLVEIAADGYLQFFPGGSFNSTVLRSLEPITLNKWTHIAITYSGTEFALFIDGKKVAVAPGSQSTYPGSNQFRIGEAYGGFVANVKAYSVVKYHQDFTPAYIRHAPVNEVGNETEGRLVFEVSDGEKINKVRNIPLDPPSIPVYNDLALRIQMSSGLSGPSSKDFVFDTRFTIEMLVNIREASVANPALFVAITQRHSGWSNGDWLFAVNPAENRNGWCIHRHSMSSIFVPAQAQPMVLNELLHVAIVKSGIEVTFFFNGRKAHTAIVGQSFLSHINNTSYLRLGSEINLDLYACKVIKGFAKYTADFEPEFLGTTQQAIPHYRIVDLPFKNSILGTSYNTTFQNVLLTDTASVNNTKSVLLQGGFFSTTLHVPYEKFLIEFRVKAQAQGSTGVVFYQLVHTSSKDVILQLGVTDNQTLTYNTGVDWTEVEEVELPDFSHVVVQRYQSTLSVFVNGFIVLEIPFPTVTYVDSMVGCDSVELSAKSYVNNLQVSKNINLYEDDYIVPYEEPVYVDVYTPYDIEVLSYTTAVMTFESGLVDSIRPTTNWLMSGNAIVSSNAIYNTKSGFMQALGSLSVPHTVVTGGAEPFTIEYSVIPQGKVVPTPAWDGPLMTCYNNSDQGMYWNSNYNVSFFKGVGAGGSTALTENPNIIFGQTKVQPEELSKIRVSYDGAAIRTYVNDTLDNVYGWGTGLTTTSQQPLRFLSRVSTSGNDRETSTLGYIDNISINDGIALPPLLSRDPLQDCLEVNLSFEGADNSYTIIDNGKVTQRKYNDSDRAVNVLPLDSTLKDLKNPTTTFTSSSVTFVESELFGEEAVYTSGTSSIISGDIPILQNNSGDKTIEIWFKQPVVAPSSAALFATRYVNNAIPFCVAFSDDPATTAVAGVNLCICIYSGSAWFSVKTAWVPTPDTWHHVALVKQGSLHTLYADGTAIGELSYAATHIVAQPLHIGARWDNVIPPYRFQGSLANFKVYPFAKYTGNFEKPETVNLKQIVREKWVAEGSAKLTTENVIDGYTHLKLDGSNLSLVRTLNAYDDSYIVKGEDVTFEITFMIDPSTSGVRLLFTTRFDSNNTVGGFRLAITASKQLTFTLWNKTSTVPLDITSTTALSAGVWYTVVLARRNMTWVCTANGESMFTIKQSSPHASSGKPLVIGSEQYASDPVQDTARNFIGYIKSFKIYKGLALTVPTYPLVDLNFNKTYNEVLSQKAWNNVSTTLNKNISVRGSSLDLTSTATRYISTLYNPNLNPSTKDFRITSNVYLSSTNETPILFTGSTTKTNAVYGTVSQQHGFELKHPSDTHTIVAPMELTTFYKVGCQRIQNYMYTLQNDVIVGAYSTEGRTYELNSAGEFVLGQAHPSWTLSETEGPFVGCVDTFKVEVDSYDSDTLYSLPLEKNYEAGGFHKNSTQIDGVGANRFVHYNGRKCVDLSGTGYIALRGSAFNFGVNDFYFSAEVYITEKNTYPSLLNSFQNNSYVEFVVGTNQNDKSIYFSTHDGTADLIAPAGLLQVNTWAKVGLSRVGNTLSIHLDDVVVASRTISPTFAVNFHQYEFAFIGWRNGGYLQSKFKGAVRNIHVVKNMQSLTSEGAYAFAPVRYVAAHLPLHKDLSDYGCANLPFSFEGPDPVFSVVENKPCLKMAQNNWIRCQPNPVLNLGMDVDFNLSLNFYLTEHRDWSSLLSNVDVFTGAVVLDVYGSANGSLTIRHKSSNQIVINNLALNTWHTFQLFRVNKTLYAKLNDSVYTVASDSSINLAYHTFTLASAGWGRSTHYVRGYVANFALVLGTSEYSTFESYEDKRCLILDCKPTYEAYLFKDSANKNVIHTKNMSKRIFKNGKYGCSFNGVDQYLYVNQADRLQFLKTNCMVDLVVLPNTLKEGVLLSSKNSNFQIGLTSALEVYCKLENTLCLTGVSIDVNQISTITLLRNDSNLTLQVNEDVVDLTEWVALDVHININDGNQTLIGAEEIESVPQKCFDGIIYHLRIIRDWSVRSLLDQVDV